MAATSPQEPPEGLNEITGRIDGLAEQLRRMEAADKRKTPRVLPTPAVAERRSLYRTIATVIVSSLVLFVLLAALSMLIRAGVFS
jgi:hypothetical protein